MTKLLSKRLLMLSSWCGFGYWYPGSHAENDTVFTSIDNVYGTVLENGSVRDATLVQPETYPSNDFPWKVTMDIVLVAGLAFISLFANIGLIYLARKTRSSQCANTSFSISSPVAHLLNSKNSGFFNTPNVWRKVAENAHNADTALTEASAVQLSAGVLRKCSSTMSMSKLNSTVFPCTPFRTSGSQQPRGRRHRRYLRGLLALSAGNITVSLSLGLWCVCRVVERGVVVSWMSTVCYLNGAIADFAQSVEIGAILWIALERTLGIHWPKERRPSNTTLVKKPCFVRLFSLCFRLHSRHRRQKNVIEASTSSCCDSVACLTSKSRSVLRAIISLMPIGLFISAFLPSFVKYMRQMNTIPETSALLAEYGFHRHFFMHTRTQPVHQLAPHTNLIYYTDSIVFTLVIGHFLVPLTVLITTNLLIYKKVASRDKQFFSRQSSSTSKSSCISANSITRVSVANMKSVRKQSPPVNGTMPVPLLRVLESSSQDLRSETNENQPDTGLKSQPVKGDEMTELLRVPSLPSEKKPVRSSGENAPARAFPQRRMSTSALWTDSSSSPFGSHSSSVATGLNEAHKHELRNSPARRKSTNDIFASFFTGRHSEPNGRVNEEPLLLQMLRRQHRRTLRILITLLVVFVLCRAPRAIILILGWLQTPGLCGSTDRAQTWLHYVTLWAETSAVLDTIVYGFWGNRTYRIHVISWCHTAFRRFRKS